MKGWERTALTALLAATLLGAAPIVPLTPGLAVSPGASLVQEGDNLQLFNTSRTVFYHDGYWIISRSLADGSLCYFYSPDGVSWSGPRLIEPFWRYHDGRGAAVWKEPYPSPYVHIVYYGVDEVLGEYRGIVSGPRTLYYRRGEVRPGGVIEWGERVAVARGIQLGFHGWEKGICVSENNVWILYQTWENENGWVAYLKCLNTGDILRLGNEVRVSESAADKQMCPLPGGRVALFSHTVYPVSPPLYAFQVRVVSTSGVESVENVYFGENTWNLNIVCSGGRLYVAFPRLERLENGDQQENVYVYGRFPEGWREVYRACVYTGGGRGVYRTPVSLTATPGGGLVLFFMRDYVWHPEGYYLGLLKTGVMVRSPDGMSWGPEEEVLHSDPDEVGFLFCDSSYYADNGRVPTFSLAVTRWVEYIPFPGRIWFWKGEVRVDNTPPVSSVDPIEPYWQLGELRDPPSDMRLKAPIKITATASDDLSGVAKVELWYRYSLDNWTDAVAWKKRPWRLYGVDDNGADGWSWEFDAPEGYGYYEFYSVAEDRAGNREGEPRDKDITADSGCRVSRDLLKVAVIPAKPNDVENFRPIEEIITTAKIIPQYFDEVSYGALAIIPPELITDDGGWFRLSRGWRYYGTKEWWQFWLRHDRTKEFGEEAIRVAGVQRGVYDIIIVVFAGPSEQLPLEDGRFSPVEDRMLEAHWGGSEATPHLITVSEFSNPIYHYLCEDITWAHEIGHALGLPDLYSTSGSWGKVDDWCLMGTRNKVHPCSWCKERLGWLRREDTSIPVPFDGLFHCIALPTQRYGGSFNSFFVDDAYKILWRTRTWYIPEYRIRDLAHQYSSHDNLVPRTGLVLYRVQQSYWGKIWRNPQVEEVALLDEYGENFTAHEGRETRFTLLENELWINEFEYPVQHYRIQRGSESGLVVTLYPMPYEEMYTGPLPYRGNQVRPDLDLHAYTYDGKHVGMNYETGEYEVQIPGARALGDYMGSEWIWIPADVEVYFTVSSRDTDVFLKEYQVENLWWLENENGFYGLQVKYTVENVEYLSLSEGDEIAPGKELLSSYELRSLPDGTYEIRIKKAMDFLSLEAWHAAIDNIPDEVFINNPKQRKNALKEKFEDVFEGIKQAETLEEENVEEAREKYLEAIEKLEHDILKKLDADAKADWVKKPVLVYEIKAFIGCLRYRKSQVEVS